MLYQIMTHQREDIAHHLHADMSHESDILLLQDGIYILQMFMHHYPHLKDYTIYVLEDDANARGIAIPKDNKVKGISYLEWVALTVKHQQCISIQSK